MAQQMVAAGTAVPDGGARDRLVAAGVGALRSRGGRPLPDLAADEVIALAGVPKSTLYQLWSNFDDYRREVLIQLLRTATPLDPNEIISAVVPILERGGRPHEILRAAAMSYFEQFSGSENFRWIMAAFPHRSEIDVAPEIARILNSARDRFEQPIALLLAASQRRPRAGISVADICQLVVATYLGLAIRERLDPGSAVRLVPWVTPAGEREQWPRVAIAVEALVSRCTEAVT